ncbi:hypothetical protein [Lacipirellula sp.]|uniref:hypothetical protein n=1 Tax=Lacipirellula sp. TaxID=2691419 RepID=UPI003D0C8ACE
MIEVGRPARGVGVRAAWERIALTIRKDCLTGTIGTSGRQSFAELPEMKFLERRELAVLAAEGMRGLVVSRLMSRVASLAGRDAIFGDMMLSRLV